MLTNLAVESGRALVGADAAFAPSAAGHVGVPAYRGVCAPAAKRERFIAPMPVPAQGTRVSALDDAGNGANGAAGTAAIVASRNRCG